MTIFLVIKPKEIIADKVCESDLRLGEEESSQLSEKAQSDGNNPARQKDFSAADVAVSGCPLLGAQRSQTAQGKSRIDH